MRVRSRGVLKSRGARTIDVSIIADDDAREVDVSYDVSTRARRRLTDDLDDSKTSKLIIRYKDETRFMVVRFHKIENYQKCNRTSVHAFALESVSFRNYEQIIFNKSYFKLSVFIRNESIIFNT